MLAAFFMGAAISVAGLAAFITSGAAAHGPFTAANPVMPVAIVAERITSQPTYSVVRFEARASTYSDDDERKPQPRRHEKIRLISGRSHSNFTAQLNYGGHEPVCVRLCDGFFFPLTSASYNSASQGSACQSLCPDAPTEVFYRNGSDKIEDAISSKGQLYTSLPVSLRYRATADNTCSCHHDVVSYAPMRDVTLRRGDAIMTPAGFMVFRGVEGAPHGADDFAALAKSSMPSAQRGALQALERVSVSHQHPTLSDWLVSQAAPATTKSTPQLEKHASNDGEKIRLLVWRGGSPE